LNTLPLSEARDHTSITNSAKAVVSQRTIALSWGWREHRALSHSPPDSAAQAAHAHLMMPIEQSVRGYKARLPSGGT
jgi:hypothetical protein